MRDLLVPVLFAAVLPLTAPRPGEPPVRAQSAPIAEIAEPAAPAPAQVSAEGYALFSWMEDGAWRFALRKGFVKGPSAEAVAGPDRGLSLHDLRLALRDLPAGERVRWSLLAGAGANGELAFPSDELRDEIQKACDAARVTLVPLHC
ncbi:MAG: hypothetical protein KIS92_08780 [Planctomycetota bacterium]|nr:hypothetical protein [Planctomycetota bacterium]